jgi:hypothetical protein
MTTRLFSTRPAAQPHLERVRAEATRVRAAFEAGPLPDPLPRFPRGACRLSSLALAAHLRRQGLGDWELCSSFRQEGPFTQTHAWLERDGVLLDITADQFNDRVPLQAVPVLLGTDHSWHAQFEPPNRHPAVPFDSDMHALAVITWLAATLRPGG